MLGTEASVVNVIWHLELAFMSDPDGRHIEDRVSCFIKAKDVVPLIPFNSGRGRSDGLAPSCSPEAPPKRCHPSLTIL